MRNIWQKIKNFFRVIWTGLTTAGKIIAGIIIIGLASLVVYAATNDTKKDESSESTPEVAQVYEPSIGSPLPATTEPGNQISGQVGGASTTTPSTETTSTPESQKHDYMTEMIAPETGINPNAPIKYESSKFGFAATLPARSVVSEKDSQVTFSSSNGKLQYIVSVNDGSQDSLDTIQAQLSNSSSVKNISRTYFAGKEALQFTADGYGSGIVFIVNGKTYYLLGDKNQFNTFKKI